MLCASSWLGERLLLWLLASMTKDTFYKVIGETIQKRRKVLGLSQQDVADHADLDTGFLSQIERGIRAPSLESVRRLSEALSTTPAALLGKSPKEPLSPLVAEMVRVVQRRSANEQRRALKVVRSLFEV